MLRHAVLCLPTWNTNLCCLKQKEKSQPIQTNDLALASGVGGGLRGLFLPLLHAQREPPSLGPSWVAAKRLGRGQVRRWQEEGQGCTDAVPFSDSLHAGPPPGNTALLPLC